MEFAKKLCIPPPQKLHIRPFPISAPIAPICKRSKCASCMDDVIVFHRSISTFFKLKGWIHCQLFACTLSKCFGPFGFPWILLLLEILVTFGPTKFKYLQGRNKHH